MGQYPPPPPPPIDFTDFVPKARNISAITKANPCVVTTEENHGYSAGNYIRIVIPYPASMQQIKDKFGLATILSANTFSLPIDTRTFDTFTTSSTQKAQAVPIAEVNETLINAVNNDA